MRDEIGWIALIELQSETENRNDIRNRKHSPRFRRRVRSDEHAWKGTSARAACFVTEMATLTGYGPARNSEVTEEALASMTTINPDERSTTRALFRMIAWSLIELRYA